MQIQTIYREEDKRTRSSVDCNPRCFHGWRRCIEPVTTVAQKGHTCKLKMLLQIKTFTCKLKIVHAN